MLETVCSTLLLSLSPPSLTRSLRVEHFPAVQACPLFSLKAIYSRTEQSADILTKLANFNDPTVRAYSDNASTTGRTLNHLLHRKDIEAVIIALPIHVQPEIIKRAISAGKHVLSEKPIAKDTETAIELVRWYKREPREEIWSVGEKFRFLASMKFGAEQLGRIGGEVITLSVKVFGFVDENDKYFQSKWYGIPFPCPPLPTNSPLSYTS